MIVGDIAPAQAEEPITSTSAEDSSIQALAERTLALKPALEISQEAITVPTPEAPVVTSKMRQLLTELAPVLLAGTSAQPSISKSIVISIV